MKKELPKPLDYIEYVMDQMNFKQSDLVKAGCGTRSHVSEMVKGKRKLTLKFIRAFLEASNREEMAHILIQDYKLEGE